MNNHPNNVGAQTKIQRVSFDIVVEYIEGRSYKAYYLRGEGIIEVPCFNMSHGDLIDYADEIVAEFFASKYTPTPGSLWYSDGVDCPMYKPRETGRIHFGMLN